MFIHNGGNNRLAGILLAAATFGVLVSGPGMIGYVPIMVVGALIFYLGISLLEEALWDPWGKTNRLEYLTVSFQALTISPKITSLIFSDRGDSPHNGRL